MDRTEFLAFLHDADFGGLFRECGWSNPTSRAPRAVTIGEETYSFTEAAQQKGFRILVCHTDNIPDSSVRRAIDAKIRRLFDAYLIIFVSTDAQFRHLWSVPVKAVDKRQLVVVEYAQDDQATFLLEKLRAISFSFDESPTIIDVTDRVNKAFLVNATEVTRNFYRGFSREHSKFVEGILNLSGKADREWYASVMLNRLMFCYFIQKKGFLDNNVNYLGDKLKWVQRTRGENKFDSFYRSFLSHLFQDGLDKPVAKRSTYFLKTYGRIPYLNGGMFAEHSIEKANKEIDIPDEVFESVFEFFDQWRWHLDTRISSTGRDINPDVIGYIFEQYINDRAQMGAYYTKEDITEYIGRNCIVPWLLKKALGDEDLSKTTALKKSGVKYIFPAMLKGADLPLPPEIEKGVAVEPQKTLRKRRAAWNAPADGKYALPTEIWRETVARRQRSAEIRRKIAAGEIKSADDFITYNLDIRAFAEDVIRNTADSSLVARFYDALRRVTILDPTCGSGAFLFAALNILEPLYEACLDRMEEFHSSDKKLFKKELDEIAGKYRSNRQYFIYKNIILRNLYGVDIMHEATEIARLRLFLKLVAVVDVDPYDANLGLDPLPDIDFNIRCGNTLVGFANPQSVKDAILPTDQLGLFTEKYDKVESKAKAAAALFEIFKRNQQDVEGSPEYYNAKKELERHLAALNEELDRAMANSVYGISVDTLAGEAEFKEWKRKTQPFHWYSEFYGITVANGGFDVIIGNPPYLEIRQIDYEITGYRSIDTGAVHAFCMERADKLINGNGSLGMIVPLSLPSTQRMQIIQEMLERNRNAWYSNYSWRPAKLFDTVNRALTIFIVRPEKSLFHTYSTCYQKWTSENRDGLFERLQYEPVPRERHFCWIPKCGLPVEGHILAKMLSESFRNVQYYLRRNGAQIYYRVGGGLYWKVFTLKPPKFILNGKPGHSSRETQVSVDNKRIAIALIAALSSNTFWWWYTLTSNVRDLNPFDINNFPIPESVVINDDVIDKGQEYLGDLEKNSVMLTRIQKKTGETQTQSFRINLSKPIIDEIDELLAKHYGFTEEELDFIINYDIKYRMGQELNA